MKATNRSRVVLFVIFGLAAAANAQGVGQAVHAVLVEESDSALLERTKELNHTIRRSWSARMPSDLSAVLQVIERVELDHDLRGEVLGAVVEVATRGELMILVQRAQQWLDRPDQTRQGYVYYGLAARLLSELHRTGRWLELRQSPEWLPLLEGLLRLHGTLQQGPSNPSLELWRGTPMDPSARERSALRVIIALQSVDAPPHLSVAVKSEEGRRRLRDALRWGTTLQSFHRGAASTLAELGDRPALTILADIRPRITEAARCDAMRDVPGAEMGSVVELYVDRIGLQSDPAKVLPFIAREHDFGPLPTQLRVWAIGRALRMGIEPEVVRAAVAQHLESAVRAAANGDDEARTAGVSIRAAAAEAELIGDGQFEDLKPTPGRVRFR